MINFSACIEMMFNDIDFYDRIKASKDAGLNAIEFWGWTDKDVDKIKKLCDENEMSVVSFFTGSKTLHYNLLQRETHDNFVEAVKETIATAKILNCKSLLLGAEIGRAHV